MRKIIPKSIEEEKGKKRRLISGLILIAIMVLSTAGYSFSRFLGGGNQNNNEQITYNGFTFTKQNGLWAADISGIQGIFSYNPKEISRIDSKPNLTINSYSGKPLYIYSESSSSEQEIYRNLENVVLRAQYACFDGLNCSGNYPVKTCDDNFIIIEQSDKSSISQTGNCIFLAGNSTEIIKTSDEFLYYIFGIQQ